MTKRALSLLLTLVMVLSLCVPALAAEDFEAEAPAEVVEEAPEAPEAPVAPEAEEPADEPVVDEPAAEEPVEAVADEPEMASILPEAAEDEPYLVALGIIEKKSHYVLEKALEKAKPYKDKADAHEVYGSVSEWGTLGNPDSRTKNFDAAYAEAQRCMDAIDGLPYTGDVSDAGVLTAAANLLTYIPVADGGTGENALSANVDAVKSLFNATAVETYITAEIAKNAYHSGDVNAPTLTYTAPVSYAKLNKAVDGLKTYYHDDFVSDLKDALAKFDALTYTATYGDWAKAVDALETAMKLQKDSGYAQKADAATLQAAITAADNAVAAGNHMAWNNENVTSSSGKFLDDLKAASTAAKNEQTGSRTETGLTDKMSYKRFNNILDSLKLKALATTINVEKQVLNYDANKVIESVTLVLSKSDKNDGHGYGYSYTQEGSYANITTVHSTEGTYTATEIKKSIPTWYAYSSGDLTVKPDTKTSGLVYANVTIYPIKVKEADAAVTPFTKDSKVHVNFYQNIIDTDGSKKSDFSADNCKGYDVNLASDFYNGPIIKSVTVDYGAPATGYTNLETYTVAGSDGKLDVVVTLSEKLTPSWLSSVVGYYTSTAKNPAVKITLLAADKTDIATWTASAEGVPVLNTDTFTLTVHADKMSKITAGDMSVEFRVMDANGKGAVPHAGCTAVAKMEMMDQYADIVAVKSAVADAKKLVEGDYELKTGAVGFTTYANAWTAFKAAIADCEADLAALTKAKTPAAIKVVNDHLWDLVWIRTQIDEKDVNIEAMLDALAAAKAVKDDGYSYQTWGRLQVAIDDAKKIEDDSSHAVYKLQSKIDAVTAELKAAQAALAKETAVNKDALDSAIAAAEALKEEDYTPESWTASKTAIENAITAAKAVQANESATQAQVNAAIEALRTAQATLVKVKPDEPEGPKAPASGTGWNYYNNEWYFFKNGKLVSNYWVGKIDGASQWDSNWYYVGADGKMLTGMQYLDDLHGGYGWYFLQPTNTKQEIGKMLTGYQWVGGQYGECYFSKASGSSGKCTWSELLGNWNGTTWVK